jgi:hypothetical protein
VRKKGIKEFEEKIAQAKNLFDYKLDILKSRFNHRDIEGKAKKYLKSVGKWTIEELLYPPRVQPVLTVGRVVSSNVLSWGSLPNYHL